MSEEIPEVVLSNKEKLLQRLLSLNTERTGSHKNDHSKLQEVWNTIQDFSEANTIIYTIVCGKKSVEEVMQTMVPSEDSAVKIMRALDLLGV